MDNTKIEIKDVLAYIKHQENTILSYHQALNAIAVCEDIKVIRAIVKETLEINK